MKDSLRKFRDRLRITLILYVFSEPLSGDSDEFYGEFRTEMRIQAIDFLLRYPDFLAYELIDLMSKDTSIDRNEIQSIVKSIFDNSEPILRVEEMEKFFHGAYESIDDVVAYLVSVGFLKYESKKRRDGKNYDRIYRLTNYAKDKIEETLKGINAVQWYFERCHLIKKFLGHFSGHDLKSRQYRYRKEYAEIPYKSKIRNLQKKVKDVYFLEFNEHLI